MLSLWLAFAMIGLITFAYRASFIYFLEFLHLPAWIQQPLRFVPVAALTAIIVPELLVHNGAVMMTWQNERLLAGLAAMVIALWTKSVVLTLVLGMAMLYLLQYLL